MNSYVVTVINSNDGVHVRANWECTDDPVELRKLAVEAVAHIVRELGELPTVHITFCKA